MKGLGVMRPRLSFDRLDPSASGYGRVPAARIARDRERHFRRPSERRIEVLVQCPEEGEMGRVPDRWSARIRAGHDVEADDGTASDERHERNPRRAVTFDPAPFGVRDAGGGRGGVDAQPRSMRASWISLPIRMSN